jgi:hypothetical protein
MTDLERFRAEKDDFFANHPQSPLTAAQKRTFRGLAYFEENPALRFTVDLALIPGREAIQAQTSTGDAREYIRHGAFIFEVEGRSAQLTIYEADHGFFLPFVDSLAGKETYPAGRYLEPEPLGGNRFLVDFNLAYNPYCAYNEAWSCPLTPFENRLKVPIRAGEKLFHE